jgi:hypothetical protein
MKWVMIYSCSISTFRQSAIAELRSAPGKFVHALSQIGVVDTGCALSTRRRKALLGRIPIRFSCQAFAAIAAIPPGCSRSVFDKSEMQEAKGMPQRATAPYLRGVRENY